MNGRAVKGAKCILFAGLFSKVPAVYRRQAKHFFSIIFMIFFISHPLPLPASVCAVSHLL